MSLHLSKEIERLKRLMSELCSKVETSMSKALSSALDFDGDMARDIIEKDREIDAMEIELEEECLKILALHQPVAVDLRYVVACLKMNNDLERIGDLSAKIAKNVVVLSKSPYGIREFESQNLREMMSLARGMVKGSLDALFEMNKDRAQKVREMDDAVDSINKRIHVEIERRVIETPEDSEYLIRLLGIARAIERIGDYATNIAEDIIYMITGEIVRHEQR
ncbi:MAG: phosphate signaling complex protein PhoU [Kiritimatiellaeota bacterium]|nr:phosphate signaling complex protein PhoU [Kiritimatiellota bacterium]